MKKFLAYSAAVIAGTVLLALANDFANVWFITHSNSSPAYKMQRLFSKDFVDEIPIIGSSRAQANLVPSLIAPNCFNYGLDGEGIGETLFHLEALAKKTGGGISSQPVIVNIDPWGLNASTAEHLVGDYRLAPASGKTKLTDRIVGIRFHGALRKSITDWLNEKKTVTKKIDNGAALLLNVRSKEEWATINANQKPYSFSIDREVYERLVNVLKSLAPRQIYLVVAPCSSRFRELYSGREEMEKFLDDIAKQPNVAVISCFWNENFTDDDFTDSTHLCSEGAKKYTHFIVNQIELR